MIAQRLSSRRKSRRGAVTMIATPTVHTMNRVIVPNENSARLAATLPMAWERMPPSQAGSSAEKPINGWCNGNDRRQGARG